MTDGDELHMLAAAGDRGATERLLEGVRDHVYRLALRMLGDRADAEDASQEIFVIVLEQLASFRRQSAFSTWVFSIAARHLMQVRKGRRETITFDTLAERLDTGLRSEDDPEQAALTAELRLRCTQAMLLSLDREHRLAWVLGEIISLSSEEAAAVLEVPSATYRKRLSRARARLHEFMRGRCGVFDAANPCRCSGQVSCAVERGLLDPENLSLSQHPVDVDVATLRHAAAEVTEFFRVGEVLRGHPPYVTPAPMVAKVRELISSRARTLLGR